MRRLLLIIGFLICLEGLRAQSTEDFVMPECQGDFPPVLTEALNTPRSAKIYNPMLVGLLKSGRVLYGTPMNDYVDRIAEKLLQDHPQLQNQIHFYILLSPKVNAYALNNGVILVTTGMLAQVTNEAELAFVMSHEIAHIYLHHALDVEKSDKKADYVTKYLNYHQHSREQELEADRVGLNTFYQPSPYSKDALDGVFDVLKYAYLPFDEIPFQRTEVEEEFYHFPDNFFLNNVSPVTDQTGIIDTLFTHPNVDKRREVVKALSGAYSDEGKVEFFQEKSRFEEVNRMARFACIDLFLQGHQYDEALYNAYVLKSVYPYNPFPEKAYVASLYGIAKHKLKGSFNSIHNSYRDVEGEMQQVSYFLTKPSRNEWSVLALRNAWKAYRENPGEEYYEQVVLDLMKDIFVEEKMQYNDFCDFPEGMLAEDIHLEEPVDTVQYENKYDRLKNNSVALVLPDKKFKTVNYMLVDIHRDSLFFSMMNRAVADATNEQILEAIAKPSSETPHTLLIVTPEVHCYKKNKTERIDAGRRQSEHLLRLMTRTAKRYKVAVEVAGNMPASNRPTTEQYNDLVKWQRWLTDYSNARAMSMIYHTAAELENYTDSVGSHHVCFVAAEHNFDTYNTYSKYIFLLATLSNPTMIPVAIANFCFPIREVRAQFVLADVATGKTQMSKGLSKNEASNRVILDNFVYTQLRSYLAR
ncbi:MAG: M48 family metallopeptidase [Bacteroidales bacterium]|nr:M48 family metallopeptidase [Bacteroidales bacterium]